MVQNQEPVVTENVNPLANESVIAHNTETPSGTAPANETVSMPDLAKDVTKQPDPSSGNSIDLLKDVELNVKIELGRAKMYVEDVLKLTEGSVVELDKLAGDPVDILVNERLVARGEVLVLNENFCVRVNQIVSEIV
jgi:flagellar motor switch protein FliN/FliY